MRALPTLESLLQEENIAYFTYYLNNEFWYALYNPDFHFPVPHEKGRVYQTQVSVTLYREHLIRYYQKQEFEMALEQI